MSIDPGYIQKFQDVGLIATIREFPVLWLGEPTLSALWHFVHGYSLALDRFFELLDEYCNRKATTVAQLLNCNRQYRTMRDGVEQVKSYPKTFSLLSYTEDPGFFTSSDNPEFDRYFDHFFPCIESFEIFAGISRSELIIHDKQIYEKWLKEDAEFSSAEQERKQSRGAS